MMICEAAAELELSTKKRKLPYNTGNKYTTLLTLVLTSACCIK